MDNFFKYIKRIFILLILLFIFIFIYFLNTSDYEYSSPGDDPEYMEKVAYERVGYDVKSLSCSIGYYPTLIVEDDFVIYVSESIFESPGIMNSPESKGAVYIKNENFDALLDDFNKANCTFGLPRDDFIAPINDMLTTMKKVTGTTDSADIIGNIYYCTDQWEYGIYGKPDFQYRHVYYGKNKKIIRCEV